MVDDHAFEEIRTRHPFTRQSSPVRPSGKAIAWLAALAMFAVLVLKNRYLFTTDLYEDGDSGANAILIDQAVRGRLFVGNYSRLGFNHPGPAFLYVQALFEIVLHRWIGLVPRAFSAHVVASYACTSAFVGAAGARIAKLCSWRWSGVVLVTVFLTSQPNKLATKRMPFLYMAPFLFFAVSFADLVSSTFAHKLVTPTSHHEKSSNVKLRRTNRGLVGFVIAGGFLVHGHIAFVMFVLTATLVLFVLQGIRWKRSRGSLVDVERERLSKREVLGVAVLLAVFTFPMVINVAANWPGEFGKYWLYVRTGKGGAGSWGDSFQFVYDFWPQPAQLWFVPILLVTAAVAVHWRNPRVRYGITAMLVWSSLAVFVYAKRGVDDLSQRYVAYFYLTIPLLTVCLLIIGVAGQIRSLVVKRTPVRVLRLAAVLGIVFAVTVVARTNALYRRQDDAPWSVPALQAIDREPTARNKTIAIDLDNAHWIEAVGLLRYLQHEGRYPCVVQANWSFLVTEELICKDIHPDNTFRVRVEGPGAASPVLFQNAKVSVRHV